MIGHYIHAGWKTRRSCRSELRDGFCGPQRGFPDAGERYRHAHRGRRVRSMCGAKTFLPKYSKRKEKFTRTRLALLESPKTSSIKSLRGSSETYYEMACLYDQKFVKDSEHHREGPDQQSGWQGWREHSGSTVLAIQDRRRSGETIHRSGGRSRRRSANKTREDGRGSTEVPNTGPVKTQR